MAEHCLLDSNGVVENIVTVECDILTEEEAATRVAAYTADRAAWTAAVALLETARGEFFAAHFEWSQLAAAWDESSAPDKGARPVEPVSTVPANPAEPVLVQFWKLPSGYTSGPEGGKIGQTWSGTAYVDPEAPTVVITPDQVVAERNRRMAMGFDYDFGDARGVHHIGTTVADMKGWDEVTQATQSMIALGAPTSTLMIVTNTAPATITALEWQQILLAATSHRQPLWSASFYLQSLSPIPVDYNDDVYWTA